MVTLIPFCACVRGGRGDGERTRTTDDAHPQRCSENAQRVHRSIGSVWLCPGGGGMWESLNVLYRVGLLHLKRNKGKTRFLRMDINISRRSREMLRPLDLTSPRLLPLFKYKGLFLLCSPPVPSRFEPMKQSIVFNQDSFVCALRCGHWGSSLVLP